MHGSPLKGLTLKSPKKEDAMEAAKDLHRKNTLKLKNYIFDQAEDKFRTANSFRSKSPR